MSYIGADGAEYRWGKNATGRWWLEARNDQGIWVTVSLDDPDIDLAIADLKAAQAAVEEWVEVEDSLCRYSKRRFSRDGKQGEFFCGRWTNVGPGDMSLDAFNAGLWVGTEKAEKLREAVLEWNSRFGQFGSGNSADDDKWARIVALAREGER